jgi:hypothetical protein
VNHSRLASALALCVAAAGTLWSASSMQAQANPAASVVPAVVAVSPIRITAPTTVNGYWYDGKVAFSPNLRVIAQGEPFELWSKRTGYYKPIHTEWRSTAGTVALPDGTMTDFTGLPGFVGIRIRNSSGELVKAYKRSACLNGYGERVTPDAPLRSPYPYGCPWNRFTRGSVMGVQEGWATRLDIYGPPIRLAKGTYQVKAFVAQPYRDTFGISYADGVRNFTLVVAEGSTCRGCRESALARDYGMTLTPAASEPTQAADGAPVGPMPDLRSLPAFGIRVARNGNFLQFSANVWNAGNSPLVVDGFRRADEDIMDAYQYFVDADGNQVGYQQVGTMEWDDKDTHQHWHFRDFARYRLLKEDRSGAVRSRKEAFCLANTDAIDYTVPGADWQPEGTDLHTSCGEADSLSIREVLSSGSGDTYAQYRAGQSFDLRSIPNGVYLIAVEANPVGKLVESSTTNNVALRKVTIGGVYGARTVKVGGIPAP